MSGFLETSWVIDKNYINTSMLYIFIRKLFEMITTFKYNCRIVYVYFVLKKGSIFVFDNTIYSYTFE